MITCINQGPNGPSFSRLAISTSIGTCIGDGMAHFIVADREGGSDSVMLDRKNTAILARKLLAWSGETLEVLPAVSGDL